jgi:hypothetical protein
MKNTLVLISLLSFNNLFSQQVLNQSLVPAPGDVYLYHMADTNNAWSNINGLTNWDFNYLNIDDTLRFVYYSGLTGTPHDTAYTTSNLVSTSDSIRYNYFVVDSTKFETIGTAADSSVSHFTNPVRNFNLPFLVGNNFNDVFSSSQYMSGPAPTIVSGNNNTFCNIIGNLNLGNIAYSNVYLVRSIQTIIYNYYNGLYTTIQYVNRYSWHDGITKFALLEYENVKTENSWEVGVVNKSATIKKRHQKSKAEILRLSDKIIVKNVEQVKKLELFNLEGKLVKAIFNSSEIYTLDLTQSFYVLKITTENNIKNIKIVLN